MKGCERVVAECGEGERGRSLDAKDLTTLHWNHQQQQWKTTTTTITIWCLAPWMPKSSTTFMFTNKEIFLISRKALALGEISSCSFSFSVSTSLTVLIFLSTISARPGLMTRTQESWPPDTAGWHQLEFSKPKKWGEGGIWWFSAKHLQHLSSAKFHLEWAFLIFWCFAAKRSGAVAATLVFSRERSVRTGWLSAYQTKPHASKQQNIRNISLYMLPNQTKLHANKQAKDDSKISLHRLVLCIPNQTTCKPNQTTNKKTSKKLCKDHSTKE